MADTERRFSELSVAATLTDNDILALSQTDIGTSTLISVRATLIAIATHIAKVAAFTNDLDTTNKTLIGAINELKQLISLIPQFSIDVVQTLPVSDISETTIYLVPSSDPEQGNYYEEYIYVNNTWELVGTTAVDLSAYYTKLEVDGLLAEKANTSDVTAALALKEAKSDMNDDVTDIVVGLTDEQTTATGNPVTLTTVQEGGAKSALVTFTPKQSGTGDPSPSNIRPISGWDELDIYLGDEESSIQPNTIYSFHINGAESNPSDKITYVGDSVGLTPAYMDYTNDRFVWGSFENAFFLPRPCMLTRDGSVAYYLDTNDYSKKLDGTASDISDDSTELNAMMEWGRNGRKIWYKIVPDIGDDTSATVYIANYQVDGGYVDYAFHNYEGKSGTHFYTPIFNGCLDANNKLRSISGKQVMASKTATNEVTYAENNNPADTPIWNIEQYCDIVLITLLLWLMGKSTNTQDVFGNGISSGLQAGCEAYRTGSLNNKGMFYGKDGSVNTTTAVKVFGMENFWGLQWRRYQGHLLIGGSQYVKMTYGQEDGSTADGFSLVGTGYINKGHQPTGTSGQYLKTQEYDSMGFYPKNANNTDASATKYYCDGFWFNNSSTRVPLHGVSSAGGALDGASAVYLGNDASAAGWPIGASLSCKPIPKTYTATFPDTIMGGSYDFVSGDGDVEFGAYTIPEIESLSQAGGNYYASFTISGIKSVVDRTKDVICECVPQIDTLGDYFGIYHISTNIVICVGSSYTVSDFNQNIAGHKVAYPLATPTEIELTPANVNLLKGSNTVWTDGDTVQIKYSELPNGNLGAVIDYIKQLEARIAALES